VSQRLLTDAYALRIVFMQTFRGELFDPQQRLGDPLRR